jgi:hypothetical protein
VALFLVQLIFSIPINQFSLSHIEDVEEDLILLLERRRSLPKFATRGKEEEIVAARIDESELREGVISINDVTAAKNRVASSSLQR